MAKPSFEEWRAAAGAARDEYDAWRRQKQADNWTIDEIDADPEGLKLKAAMEKAELSDFADPF